MGGGLQAEKACVISGGSTCRPSASPWQGPSPPSSCSYRDALTGGRALAPPLDDTRSPRTPGGSHIPVTVSRNVAATTAQHSPTILAQSGCTSRTDPFALPVAHQGSTGGAGGVPRKISFDFFSTSAAAAGGTSTTKPSPLPGGSKVCGKT